jgi:hypothetical protein
VTKSLSRRGRPQSHSDEPDFQWKQHLRQILIRPRRPGDKSDGRLDGGKLELTEFGEKNKPSGKFSCKRPFDDPIDRECYWSKPDGSGESFVTLNEQYIALTNGLVIVPKLITNRVKGINVSYPQLESAGTLSPAAQKFNRRILALTQKAIKDDFQPLTTREFSRRITTCCWRRRYNQCRDA